MKPITIRTYRDGGTREIVTDEGSYWIPFKGSGNYITLYKGAGYFQGKASYVEDPHEVFEVLCCLVGGAEFYFDLQRMYFNESHIDSHINQYAKRKVIEALKRAEGYQTDVEYVHGESSDEIIKSMFKEHGVK